MKLTHAMSEKPSGVVDSKCNSSVIFIHYKVKPQFTIYTNSLSVNAVWKTDYSYPNSCSCRKLSSSSFLFLPVTAKL